MLDGAAVIVSRRGVVSEFLMAFADLQERGRPPFVVVPKDRKPEIFLHRGPVILLVKIRLADHEASLRGNLRPFLRRRLFERRSRIGELRAIHERPAADEMCFRLAAFGLTFETQKLVGNPLRVVELPAQNQRLRQIEASPLRESLHRRFP